MRRRDEKHCGAKQALHMKRTAARREMLRLREHAERMAGMRETVRMRDRRRAHAMMLEQIRHDNSIGMQRRAYSEIHYRNLCKRGKKAKAA